MTASTYLLHQQLTAATLNSSWHFPMEKKERKCQWRLSCYTVVDGEPAAGMSGLTASHFSLSFLTASLSFLFLKKRPSRRMKEREVRTSLAVNLSFSLQNSLSLFQRKEEKRESICKRKERESLPGSYQSILSALIFLLTVTTARAWQPSCSLTSCNRLRENSQGFQLPGLKKMFWKMAWSPLTFSFQKGSW